MGKPFRVSCDNCPVDCICITCETIYCNKRCLYFDTGNNRTTQCLAYGDWLTKLTTINPYEPEWAKKEKNKCQQVERN